MTAFFEYTDYDAVGLAGLIARREVAATEVLEAAIATIDKLNPRLNAVIEPMYDRARRQIAAGLPAGPLAGTPYALKDIGLLYTGVPTRGGSRLFQDYVPDHDSTLVQRLRSAGVVILAKTNTPEFALTVATEPRLFGPTHNPWRMAYSCGGSSGGSAAAVASGMVPAAHGGDGGGSIRVPAAHCGLVGLKPTRARNPAGPDLGEGWSGVSVDHALTRSLRDTAALLDATHGAAPGDPYCAPVPAGPFAGELGRAPGRLRIAFSAEAPNGVAVHGECARAANAAAHLCETLGHTVEESRFEFDMAAMVHAYRVIVASNLHNVVEARLQQLGRELRDDDLEPITRARVAEYRRFSGADYAAAVQRLHVIGRQLAAFFEHYDVVLSPTAAQPPLRHGEIRMDGTDLDSFDADLFGHAPFTAHFNVSGCPAISLPLHWTHEGLPVGVHFGARFGAEATLLRLASQIEAARPWRERHRALIRSLDADTGT